MRKLKDVKQKYPEVGSANTLNVALFRLANYLSTDYGRHSEQDVLNQIVNDISRAIDVSGMVVALVKQQHQSSLKEREIFFSSGLLRSDAEHFRSHLADTLLNEVTETKQRILHADTKTSLLKEHIGTGGKTRIASLLAIPMIFRKKVLGVLIAFRNEINAFTPGQLRSFDRIARFIVQDIKESKNYYEATLDLSSGLYHRQAMLATLRREIERASRYQAPLSISFLDIDGYSFLEPNLLEDKSSKILKKLSTRFLDEVRQADICGRVAEDTFLFIHPMSTCKNAIHVAKRVIASLQSASIIVGEGPVDISLSIGVTEFVPGSDDISTFLSRGDSMLQGAKRFGGGAVVHD